MIRPDGKHIKKRKKYEDPRKPKKALPPYLLFVQVCVAISAVMCSRILDMVIMHNRRLQRTDERIVLAVLRDRQHTIPYTAVFKQDNRDAALAEFPGMSLPDVTKILGARWGMLPEAKKQEYINRHEANRQVYEAQLAEYETENQVSAAVTTLIWDYFRI